MREVHQGISQILDSPTRWPIYKYETRKFLLRRFPFHIFYLDLPDCIWIVAEHRSGLSRKFVFVNVRKQQGRVLRPCCFKSLFGFRVNEYSYVFADRLTILTGADEYKAVFTQESRPGLPVKHSPGVKGGADGQRCDTVSHY